MRRKRGQHSISLEIWLAEETTYERYTGFTSPWLHAYRQTQKAVDAYRKAYGHDRP